MKLLIVAATGQELTGFLEHYKLPEGNFLQTPGFDILITGVGMTATAFALGKNLTKNYSLVLNVGIAGCFDRSLQLGDLLQISSDTFAELGAEDHENFQTIDELGFGKSAFTASAEVAHLPSVSGITVNKVHGNTESITKTLKLFTAQTESMEGAAVFYACEKENIPCLQVRSISNYVEARNREYWEIGLAIKNLNNWLIDFTNTPRFSLVDKHID